MKSAVIGNGITEIRVGMFYQCSSLEDIEIPETIFKIGGSAFMSCTSLNSIKIPDNVTEFGI